jgi:hypothetical protein
MMDFMVQRTKRVSLLVPCDENAIEDEHHGRREIPAGARPEVPPPDTAGDELAHLRAENALLRATLDGASQAMAAAPIWHTQHRVLGEILSSASRKLAELDAARAAQAAPPAARRESPERDLSPPGPGYAQLAPVGVKETSGRPCVVSLRATPTRPPAATAPQGVE